MVESDEEQLEVLKNWWDENATSVVVTVVLTLGGVFGYQAWENNVLGEGEAASALYEDLVQASAGVTPGSEDPLMMSTATSLSKTLKTDHPGTAYAIFAALHMAKLNNGAGKLDDAISELQWALEQGTDSNVELIIQMRLARLHLANGDPDAALALLSDVRATGGQLSSVEEIKGDIYQAMGDLQKAREAYQLAIENTDEKISKPLLGIKLADIPLVDTRTPSKKDEVNPEADTDANVDNDA